MPTVIQISDSPLARDMRRAIEAAYHDDSRLSLSLVVKGGPGAQTITLEAEAVLRFCRENGLDGHITQDGQCNPLSVKFPKETKQVLFFIG